MDVYVLCTRRNTNEAGSTVIVRTTREKAFAEISFKRESKGSQPYVDMNYTTGDRLKLTGISGIFSSPWWIT